MSCIERARSRRETRRASTLERVTLSRMLARWFLPACARASTADEERDGEGTKRTDDDSDADADDLADARGAVELYAAYERRMLARAHSSASASGRVLAASTTTSEGEGSSETTTRGRAVDASDTGAVEIALRRLRSEQFLRAAERRARKARERAGATELVHDTDIMGKRMRKNYALVRERFAATLYAKMEAEGKPRWTSLGRRVCEPSVDAEGALVPLFRDEETRRTNVARALFCAPKWTAPRGCDARTTTFHLVLETLPPPVERDVVTEADARKKIANDRDALANTKGKLFGDLKFTLMDLCAGPERRLEAEARAPLPANARAAARGALRAECVLQLTPFDFSRPRGRHRDITPPRAMPFEELFDQYEDALVDADAVVGVEHHRQRKRRLKSALRAKSFIDPRRTSHRLIAVDDSTTFDDLASERRRSKTSNRAVGARVRRAATPSRPRRSTDGTNTPTTTLARDRWNA